MVSPERYLSLLKKALINELYVEAEAEIVYALHCVVNAIPIDFRVISQIRQAPDLLRAIEQGKEGGRTVHIAGKNSQGQIQVFHQLRGAVEVPHTMIGRKRIDNLHACLELVRTRQIPGDLIETGVWRGGATIFMRGYLQAYGISDRLVWVADSFEGVPPSTLPQDMGVDLSKSTNPFLAVSLDEVKSYFARYELLDDQVRFLPGWFRDTLTDAAIGRLAILRLDGDLYESTMDALTALYPKVSAGGFVIVDDYYTNPTCEAAVHDFRQEWNITDEIIQIDDDGVYWERAAP